MAENTSECRGNARKPGIKMVNSFAPAWQRHMDGPMRRDPLPDHDREKALEQIACKREQTPFFSEHPPDIRGANITAPMLANINAVRTRDEQSEGDRPEQISEEGDGGNDGQHLGMSFKRLGHAAHFRRG